MELYFGKTLRFCFIR